jgi:DNA-binding MarR family transcriptional regulator
MSSTPVLTVDPEARVLYESFELLRLLDTEMPAQLVTTFFFIAAHGPVDTVTIANRLNLRRSSCSRNTDWLSADHRLPNKAGLGLIIKEEHPTNWRTRLCRLSPKGESLIKQIKEKLYGDIHEIGPMY